jgi:hypothetical protein
MASTINPLCTSSNPAACDTTDLVKTPVKLFTRRQFTFPMSSVDIEANFPAEYELFRATSTVTGVSQPVSNLMGGDEVPCPFLLCGVCVQITPEYEAWTLPVHVIDTVAAPSVTTPQNNGIIPLAGIAGTQKGTAEWGGATQRFAVDFLLAYRLRFLLQCKYEMFDVPLSDIGCVDAAGNFTGAGTGGVAALPGTAKINAQYAALNSRFRALAQNVIGAPATELANQPVVDTSRGGISFQGGMAGFYLCPAPVLLAPCCRVNMSLYQGEGPNMYLPRARAEAADSTANQQSVSPDVWNAQITGVGALNAGAVVTMKGGAVAVGITLLGYNLTLGACQQYFMQALPGDLLAMYGTIPNVPGMAEAARAMSALQEGARD